MAQAHKHNRPSPTESARTGKNLMMRTDEGQFVKVKAGALVAEVPVSKARFERIVGKPRVIGKVIAGYADSAARAKRTGKPSVMAFMVTPDGQLEAMVEKAAGDPLNAALAAAKARGQAKIAEILKGEDMLTARDFAPLLGASHETVNTRRKKGEILGLEGATRGVRYPRWQMTDEGLPLPGLSDLFAALGEQPWTVYRFLRTAHAELGGETALDALKAGQIEAVMGVAQNQAAGAFA